MFKFKLLCLIRIVYPLFQFCMAASMLRYAFLPVTLLSFLGFSVLLLSHKSVVSLVDRRLRRPTYFVRFPFLSQYGFEQCRVMLPI